MNLLDRLARDFPEASRQARKHWLRSGRVKVEGAVEKNALREVADSARVSLAPKAAAQPFGAAARAIRVVFEDGALIALDKPPGLLTVPTRLLANKDSLQSRVVKYLKGKGQQALVVHRLDRKTSGLVLFAKSEAAREKLKAQFAERTVVRKYLARVWGKVSRPQGELKHWLLEGEDLLVRIVPPPAGAGPRVEGRGSRGPGLRGGRFVPQAPFRMVDRDEEDDDDDDAPPSRRQHRASSIGHRNNPDAPLPKEAITRYRVSLHEPETTLLALSIKTGRRAQIRVQLNSIGHPIVGDHLYGRGAKPGDRMHLHASGLEFVHPASGQVVKLEIPLPPQLREPPPPGSAPRDEPRHPIWDASRARRAPRFEIRESRFDGAARRHERDRPTQRSSPRAPSIEHRASKKSRPPREDRRPASRDSRPEATDRPFRPGRSGDERRKQPESGSLRINKPRRSPPRK